MSDVQGAAPPAPAPSPAPAAAPAAVPSAPAAPQPVTIIEQKPLSFDETIDSVTAKILARDPDRDPYGRFASKDTPAAEPAKTEAPAAETAPQDQAQTDKPVEPAKPAIDAPQSWSAEMKAEWAKLSPAQQEYVAKRESEATKRISELGNVAKSAENVRNVIDKHRASLRGANEAEALDKLFAASAYLERSPTEAIQWLANAYRVDLRQFAASNQSPESVTPESEQFARALAERDRQIAELTRAVNETRNHVLSEQQQKAQSQQATLAKLIDDFKADKPHWEKLEDDVYSQVIALRTSEPNLEPGKLLEKAYSRAIRVNDDVSKQVEADKRATEAKAKAAEDAKKADEAKRLSSLNTKSREGASSKRTGGWENTIDEVAAKIARRG